jgi:hypothetical protein
VSYRSIIGNLSSPFFGQPVSALSGRRMQVALRSNFWGQPVSKHPQIEIRANAVDGGEEEAILDRFNMSLVAGLGRLAGRIFGIGYLDHFNDLMLAGTPAGAENRPGIGCNTLQQEWH